MFAIVSKLSDNCCATGQEQLGIQVCCHEHTSSL